MGTGGANRLLFKYKYLRRSHPSFDTHFHQFSPIPARNPPQDHRKPPLQSNKSPVRFYSLLISITLVLRADDWQLISSLTCSPTIKSSLAKMKVLSIVNAVAIAYLAVAFARPSTDENQFSKRGFRCLDPPKCTRFEHYRVSVPHEGSLSKRGFRCLDPPACTKFKHYPDSASETDSTL